MVIDYEKYPALKLLTGTNAKSLKRLQNNSRFYDYFDMFFDVNFERYLSKFKRQITFLAMPFLEAASKAMPKVLPLYKTEYKTINIAGTYVAGEGVYFVFSEWDEGRQRLNTCFFAFHRLGYPLYFVIDDEYNPSGIGAICGEFTRNNKIDDGSKFLRLKVLDHVATEIFRKYAAIETKTLFPKRKERIGGEKYLNNTDLNITQLDSKWFTNLVKSEGFKVRGHFRLQPCKKDGQWTRELIWIDEFQKTGYTAPARKLAAGEFEEM